MSPSDAQLLKVLSIDHFCRVLETNLLGMVLVRRRITGEWQGVISVFVSTVTASLISVIGD